MLKYIGFSYFNFYYVVYLSAFISEAIYFRLIPTLEMSVALMSFSSISVVHEYFALNECNTQVVVFNELTESCTPKQYAS